MEYFITFILILLFLSALYIVSSHFVLKDRSEMKKQRDEAIAERLRAQEKIMELYKDMRMLVCNCSPDENAPIKVHETQEKYRFFFKSEEANWYGETTAGSRPPKWKGRNGITNNIKEKDELH